MIQLLLILLDFTFDKWHPNKVEQFVINVIDHFICLNGTLFVRIERIQIIHDEFTTPQQTKTWILFTEFISNLVEKKKI